MSRETPNKAPETLGSDVMGVTKDSMRFIRASGLYTCESCGETGLHISQVAAVRPKDHAVMICSQCMPEPPEEWL